MTEWGTGRWWRVIDPTKDWPASVWCETSDEEEARDALKTCPGGVLYRDYERCERKWVEVR